MPANAHSAPRTSASTTALPLDRMLFVSKSVRVGAFGCATDDPRFFDSGPIQNHLVVFPRTSVWIEAEGHAPGVADPGVVLTYDRGQVYRRRPLCKTGDHCDWFAVSPEIAMAIREETDRRHMLRPAGLFGFSVSRTPHQLYLRQRQLFLRLERGRVHALEAEEEVLRLVELTVCTTGPTAAKDASSLASLRRHRDIAEEARAELGRDRSRNAGLTVIAAHVGISPFHLCRIFRQQTGTTLNQYRLDIRLREALDALESRSSTLSQLAHELGFASHSHFTVELRRRFGFTPSAFRTSMPNWSPLE